MSDRKKHYEAMGIDPWMVVNTWPIEQQVGVYRFSALKYIMRLGHKDESAQEVQKAIDSMQELLKVTLAIDNAKVDR